MAAGLMTAGNAAGGLGALLGGPLGWATLGANVLGGIFGGASKAKQFKEELRQRQLDRDLERYKYDRTQAQSEGNDAASLSRSMDYAPLRDRAAYMMGSRMLQTPGGFHPGNSMNPGSIGGVDNSVLANANSMYKPGAGGTGGSQAVAQAFLKRLGYGTSNTPWNSQQYWTPGSGMSYV